ncbi:hypothetical protein NKOR_06095 [Candidatus Nitrosopumilus koreensis AR1]|uniref:Uncharacterized protein n=1 Tax=Candidatus Nitrosopumilus koreensis AR1 TaxID=1229908 RepID=K0B7F7_9ARCH|nr:MULTISPECIES: hypothetical protein [Nitrosopumilus]AFS81102.1 hypothetical protein NKOR_06095 [Candidatus Nitrosopumilus koreensis AR1]
MQTNQTTSWKELQDQFQDRLKKFDENLTTMQFYAEDLQKIYRHIMEKSKDDSPEIRNKFIDLWLDKIDVKNDGSLLAIKDDYETFLNGPKPASADFKNFEASLEHKLYQKSISSLEAYHLFMNEFFNAWKKMWKNKS